MRTRTRKWTRGRPVSYLRADPEDMSILDGDDRKRAKLIAERLRHWKSIKST